MRRLRVTVAAATLAGVLAACGGVGRAEPTARPSVTPSSSATTSSTTSSTTTGSSPAARAGRASIRADVACDRNEALDAVLASDGAEADGHIVYLECLDGFGWALYSIGLEAAHVLLSTTGDGYEVLHLGTSVCPRDSGMPADVARAIAPSAGAAEDCPEPSATVGEAVGPADPAPEDEGHQPWREACVEDPTAYAGCEP